MTGFDLRTGMDLSGATFDEVWVEYVALGGTAEPDAVARCIDGVEPLPPSQYDLIALVLNERFLDLDIQSCPVHYQQALTRVEPPVPDRGARMNQLLLDTERIRQQAVLIHARSAALQRIAAHLLERSGQRRFADAAARRAAANERRAGLTG